MSDNVRRFHHEMFSKSSNEEAREKGWEQNVFVQVEHRADRITQCTDNLPVPMQSVYFLPRFSFWKVLYFSLVFSPSED